MKKLIVLLILIIFSSGFSAGAVSDFARSRIFYDNQYELLITHPNENSRITTSSRMSFLGDSDTRHRLFINSEEINRTPDGFFTYYAELEIGENTFIIRNGENIETLVITRETPEPWLPPETFYFPVEIFGSVEGDYIPRFAYFDDDLHAKTPLMSGTTFRIIGERGEYYILADGTAMFKSHVFQLGRTLRTVVSGGEIFMRGNNVSVSFDVTENPLYEIIFDDNKAILIIYADGDLSDLSTGAPYIIEISKSVQTSPDAIIYEIEFERVPVGYIVGFNDGKMNIDFRFPPVLLSDAFILLDAGHGGADPGALGPPGEFGSMEKDFNLYVAQTARDYLLGLGMQVILIRDTNEFVQIMDRVEYFALQPDIVVSVHANSAPLSSNFANLSGPLMYYTLDISERAADEMIELINYMVSGFTPHAPLPWHRRRNFAMARYTGGPSMLFEMGFLCNPAEYELMLNIPYLDRLGLSLGMSIEQYIKNLMVAEDPEVIHTFAPFPPPPMIYEIEDAVPVLLQIRPEASSMEDALFKYILFISSVMLCGILLWLPSGFIRSVKNRNALMRSLHTEE
ncbi:MAG: N-acetylmuramoyl-L-alanine amidase [Oscillospiraceae bacterium]|nr:N-acetylmuramoyl-L-alanine amidase [Oscillospiraceae bacterium]